MKQTSEVNLLKEIEQRKGEYRVYHKETALGIKTTLASIRINGEYQIGSAECSPKDNWNRKRGRTIALGKALLHWKIWLGEKKQFYNHKTKHIEPITDEMREMYYKPIPENSTTIPEILKIKDIPKKPKKPKAQPSNMAGLEDNQSAVLKVGGMDIIVERKGNIISVYEIVDEKKGKEKNENPD